MKCAVFIDVNAISFFRTNSIRLNPMIGTVGLGNSENTMKIFFLLGPPAKLLEHDWSRLLRAITEFH